MKLVQDIRRKWQVLLLPAEAKAIVVDLKQVNKHLLQMYKQRQGSRSRLAIKVPEFPPRLPDYRINAAHSDHYEYDAEFLKWLRHKGFHHQVIRRPAIRRG